MKTSQLNDHANYEVLICCSAMDQLGYILAPVMRDDRSSVSWVDENEFLGMGNVCEFAAHDIG